jgi:hypothetical protein
MTGRKISIFALAVAIVVVYSQLTIFFVQPIEAVLRGKPSLFLT